jgi:SAM-dependent methyltransferase
MRYDEDYFQRGVQLGISNYTQYSWKPELTLPVCFRLIEILGLTPAQPVLDFGCALGYTVYGLRLLYRQAYGCDISPYALTHCPRDVQDYVFPVQEADSIPCPPDRATYTWIIAKDVLEHIEEYNLCKTLECLRAATEGLFVVVPLGDGKRFTIPYAEMDVTHRLRQPLGWWGQKFIEHRFTIIEATYYIPGLKDTWKDFKYGYGYFILK